MSSISIKERLELFLKDKGHENDIPKHTNDINEFVNILTIWYNNFNSSDIRDLKFDELFEYLTPDDVWNKRVSFNSELDHVKEMYRLQRTNEINMNKNFLQTPQQTFGDELKSQICLHCQSHNTITMALQKRSSDEPTSYYIICKTCNKTSKEK
jgi:DNA-directed RNA polymerase subunit M/transcription elongation factor TFIIS